MGYIFGEDKSQASMMPFCFDEIITEDNQVRLCTNSGHGFLRATLAKTGGFNE